MTAIADKLRNLSKKPGAENLAKAIDKADERKAQAKKNPYKGKGKPKTQAHDSQLHVDRVDSRRARDVHENKQNRNVPNKQVKVTVKPSRKPKTPTPMSGFHVGSEAMFAQKVSERKKVQNSSVSGAVVSKSIPLYKPGMHETLTKACREEQAKLLGDGKIETLTLDATKAPGRGAKEVQVHIDSPVKDTLTQTGIDKLAKLAEKNSTSGPKIGNGLDIKKASFAQGHIAGATEEKIETNTDVVKALNGGLKKGELHVIFAGAGASKSKTDLKNFLDTKNEERKQVKKEILEGKKSIRSGQTSNIAIDEKGLSPDGETKKVPIYVASPPRGQDPDKPANFYHLDESGFLADVSIGDLVQGRKDSE